MLGTLTLLQLQVTSELLERNRGRRNCINQGISCGKHSLVVPFDWHFSLGVTFNVINFTIV